MRRFFLPLLSFAALLAPAAWGSTASRNVAITVVAPSTITAVNLSSNGFVGGSASGTIVGVISVTLSPSTPAFSGSLSLSGSSAAQFQVVGASLETNGALSTGTYQINIIASENGLHGSPFTQPEIITGTGSVGNLLTSSVTTPAAQADQASLCYSTTGAVFPSSWTWNPSMTVNQPRAAVAADGFIPHIEQIRNGVVIATWTYLGSGVCGGEGLNTTYLNPQADANNGCGAFGRSHFNHSWAPGDIFKVYPAIYADVYNQPYIGPLPDIQSATVPFVTPLNISIIGVTQNGIRPTIVANGAISGTSENGTVPVVVEN